MKNLKALAAVLLMLPLCLTGQYQMNSLYNVIKTESANIPPPPEFMLVEMGTFNAFNASFEGKKTIQPPPVNGKPRDLIYANFEDYGRKFKLKFKVIPENKQVKVTCAGQSKTGMGTVEIVVPTAGWVDWKIEVVGAPNTKFNDKIELINLPVPNFGVFTIALLPVTIVYEPPADQRKMNKAVYRVEQSFGTTLEQGFKSSSSTTRKSEVQPLAGLSSFLDGAAAILKPKSELAAIVGGIQKVVDAFGRVDQTKEMGSEVEGKYVLKSRQIFGSTISTDINDGGPGKGDVMCFLRNVRFAFVADRETGMLISPLDFETKVLATAASLKNSTDPDVQAFLKLNPFFPGGASLTSGRFRKLMNIELRGNSMSGEDITHEVEESDFNAQTTFETTIKDYKPGFLGHFGIGVDEEKTTKSRFSQSSSREVTEGTKIQSGIELYSAANEYAVYEIFFDKVFNTFAVKKKNVVSESQDLPIYEATAQNSNGTAAPNTVVTLKTENGIFTTKSDATGKYSFFDPEIEDGDAEIFVKGKKKPVKILKKN